MAGITGYRELSPDEVRIINGIKERANLLGVQIAWIERNPDGLDIDQRWVAIAKTHFQQGFMALVRAVAKPEGF